MFTISKAASSATPCASGRRKAVVSQVAGASSGSSASQPRTAGFVKDRKKQGADHSASSSGNLLAHSSISKPTAIPSSLPKSSNLQKSGSPYGVSSARARETGFGTGAKAKHQHAGHSCRPFIPKSTLYKTPSSLASTVCGPRSRKLLQAGAVTREPVQVTSLKSCVKRADNAACSKKRVHFGAAQVREFVSQPGDRFPGPAVLFEGEVNWKAWKEQIAKNDEEYIFCRAYADAVNEQLRQEENERREHNVGEFNMTDTICCCSEDAKAFEDARQRLKHEIFETSKHLVLAARG